MHGTFVVNDSMVVHDEVRTDQIVVSVSALATLLQMTYMEDVSHSRSQGVQVYVV